MRDGIGSCLEKTILLAVVLLAALGGVAAHAGVLSDTPTTSTWVTNGPVYAIAHTSNTIYLGGKFSYVGPLTGYGVPLSAATGQPAASYPLVNGTIRACAADGAGGWFIGGDFSRVGTFARNRLAHILTDGSVDASWNPDANKTVTMMAVWDGKVYIGGAFTNVGGQTRNYLAALDAASGAVTAWNPYWIGSIYAMAAEGGTIYIAGSSEVAALDAVSGAYKNWGDWGGGSTNADNIIFAISVSGGKVYVGGYFHEIGGTDRNHLAALDESTGAVTDWNPNADFDVFALAVSGGTVYAGGYFTNIGGQARNHLAALDTTSGTAKAWNPDVTGSTVKSLALSGGTVYAAGVFSSVGGQKRINLAALDAVSGAVTNWRPMPGNNVYALAATGDSVYVGGDFTSIGGVDRNNLAALEASSGTATAWNPDVSGYSGVSSYVNALAVSSGTVYVGGVFHYVGGQTRNYLAAVDAASGMPRAWNPDPNFNVNELAVSGGKVYVGGLFFNIGGQSRRCLAAVDAGSGAVTAWNPNFTSSGVSTFVIAGTTVYAGGGFTQVGYQTRNRLAALDAISGALAAWNPNVTGSSVSALALSGGRVYAGGNFSGVGGQARNNLAALDAANGTAKAWNPDANNGLRALAVLAGKVYAGGLFSNIGGQGRNCLAALDASTGAVTAWDPNATATVTELNTSGIGSVYAMDVAGGTLYAGGDFTSIGGQLRPYFAQFTPLTPFAPPAPPTRPEATAVQTDRLTWTWTDASDDEDCFKLWADPGVTTPTTQRTQTDPGATAWLYDNLAPNTPYTFQVAASNTLGDSARTDPYTTWTQIQPLGGLAFTSVSSTGLSVAPTATLSNLTSGSSGLYLANTTAGTSSGWRQSAAPWVCSGLTPNTRYLFSGKSRNGVGVETTPTTAACTTPAAAPVIGGNVSCDHATGPLYPKGTTFGFFNPAGFGLGTHGGSPYRVSRFRYAWDTVPLHTFGWSEPSWSAGVLTLKPTATGRWYLHLQSINAAGVAGATLDYGPFDYDQTPPVALSNTLSTPTWATNGEVISILRTLDTIYLGGSFNYVGPATGCGVPLSMATGQPASPFPRVDGLMNTCVPDGAGGWYIGGSFTQVGTLACACLAHILADGRVDPAWNPNANGAVYALARSGGTVYAGGTFTSVGGQTRNYLAALDAASGAVMAWTPNPNGSVGALAVSGATVYAGGTFTSIGGQPRNRLAAIDMAKGTATAWDPDANGSVSTLVVSGGTVYASGLFTSIGGQARNKLAALDASSGVATAWDPNPNNPVFVMAVSGSIVYAGGAFTSIGGQARNHLAALDVSSGAATAWDPNVNNYVSGLAVAGGTVYLGGLFSSVGGQARNYLAAVDAASGAVTAWNPVANSLVSTLVATGTTVYAGGAFSSVGGQTRNRLAAVNAASGAVTAWNPNPNGDVTSLAVSDGKVYVAGAFTSIGGQARNRLAALDTTSGTATSWNPNPNNSVRVVAAAGGTIYAGGAFTSIGGQTRLYLAALDPVSGAATAWNPKPDGQVVSLVVSGQTVYAAGFFSSMNGQMRQYLAALDASSGTPTAWNPTANGIPWALAVSGGTVYAGGSFTSIGGQARNRLAALDSSSGAVTAWNPNVSGGSYPCIYALAVSGGTVYAGGSFASIGGRPRSCLAAVDASSGMATAWNPGIGSTNTQVEALVCSAGTVYAGGNLLISAGPSQSCFAQFDPLAPPAAPVNPGGTDIQSDRLTWAWTDASDNEDGFKVYAGPGASAPAAVTSTTQAGMQSFVMRGLMPNTQYAFQVAATNAASDSTRTGVITTFTLAAEPRPGWNLQASKAPGAAQPLGTAFVFSNPMGFGVGRVSAFRWAWDQTTTHSFSGGEPLWNSGSLTLTPAGVGSYYLHLQSINAAGVAHPATLDLGAFVVVVPPSITIHPTSRTVNPGANVSFSVAATGTAPLAYQWLKNGSELSDGGRIAGAKTATLTLSNAAWSDSGHYACQVSNAAGRTTSTVARLIVNPTLTIVSAHGAPLPAVGSTVYTSGTLLTVRVPTAAIYDPADAAGTTRWLCTGWTATGSAPATGSTTSVSFKLTQPTTLTWLWKTQYKLAAIADPSSRGSLKLADGVTAAHGTWQDAGSTVLLRAMPNAGSRFAFWWGALSSRSNPASLLMTQSKTIGARFDAQSNGVLDWLAYP